MVTREVARGTHFATALEVEVEVAEMLVALLPHVDKVRFANTGTEAATGAFRLARGHTGRRKIIKFEGHYHGWWDAVLVNTNPLPPTMFGHPNDPVRIPDSSGIPEEAWKDTIVVRWNDFEAIERAMKRHGHDAACVVTEGVMSNMGVIPPRPGYLKHIQDLCRHHGALFYLDETVTGFRLAAGGCAELYGLDPDIVTYGKAPRCCCAIPRPSRPYGAASLRRAGSPKCWFRDWNWKAGFPHGNTAWTKSCGGCGAEAPAHCQRRATPRLPRPAARSARPRNGAQGIRGAHHSGLARPETGTSLSARRHLFSASPG